MSDPARGPWPKPPEDRYGRRLLTVMGFFVIVAGIALLWKDSGTGSVTAGVTVVGIGAAMTFAAAFFNDARGIVRLRGSELEFGQPAKTDAESAAGKRLRRTRWLQRRKG